MSPQAGQGTVDGRHHVAATEQNVLWGRLPCRETKAVLTVDSGDTVTFDTVSHEGILEDQGRDPVAFFGSYGVPEHEVLDDARELAASAIDRDPAADGPHVILGPVHVRSALPGDLLKVEILGLRRRADYGIVSTRHGCGALPGEFAATGPEFTFCRAEAGGAGRPDRGIIAYGGGREVRFPLAPFLGILGVATDEESPAHTVPPGMHGGNLDIRHLVTGSALYLPVQTEGAGFHTGDPHYAQGNGEVALTAFEAPLRATVRLTVVKDAATDLVARPFAETDTHWIPVGLHADLDEAMRDAVRAALGFLTRRFGMERHAAYAYLSAAADFEISQVVDQVKGVHCLIRKSDFDS
ncbi:acetamidase/formamidase family protein [Streptomyces sp. NPDC050658]|uniref:acetamidase/formamidase family protein n=1 Tax=unclassified Streptomyces TaxID=2593676 RepID=UPI00341F18B5